MALTHLGTHSTAASLGGLFQHQRETRPQASCCICKRSQEGQAQIHLKAGRPVLQSSTFFSRGICKALTAQRTTLSPRTEKFSAVAEAKTDGEAESVLEPKERTVEVDPFAIPKASPLQTAASLALTSLIGVLLFRSVRRRAQRAKGVRLRSDREESVDLLAEAKTNSLKTVTPNVPSLPASKEGEQRKSPLSILFGAAVAGAIAAGLWLFTTKVEAVFDAQRLSPDYQIRQISITIKTIVVGLSYLSTFVFAFNSIGLVLYAGQLVFGLDQEAEKKGQSIESKTTKDEVLTANDDSTRQK